MKNITLNIYQKPLFFLILLYLIRLIVTSFFIKHSYYADEFNDYFTTAHGVVFSHTLGEWYVRTDMRSYVIVQPLVFLLQFFKAIGIKSLFLQFEGTKLAIGFFSLFGLYFAYQFAILRWDDARKAFIIGLIYIFHPFIIYYNQSLLTEQMSATIFLFHFYCYAYLEKNLKDLGHLKLFVLLLLMSCSAALSVMARLDAALFLLPFYAWFVFSFNRKKIWMVLPFSFLAAFLVMGFLEQIYSGAFYGPQLNRFLFEGVKRGGYIGAVSPFYFTLDSLAGNTLHVFFFLFLFYFIRDLKKPDIYTLPLICYVAFHLWLPHKEFRYVYPIVLIMILFLFERLPLSFIKPNVSKVFPVFWLLLAVNALIVSFFIPWSGQPRLPQQIAEVNHLYRDQPVYITEPPNVHPHNELDPFMDHLEFFTIDNRSQLPQNNYILFVEARTLDSWKDITEKCREITPLTDSARENLRRSNYYHYYCP